MEFSLRYPPVTGRLYTRYAPVRRSSAAYCYALLPLDLHVLSLPLAFILSQDQTLHCKNCFFFTFDSQCPSHITSYMETDTRYLLFQPFQCPCASFFNNPLPEAKASAKIQPFSKLPKKIFARKHSKAAQPLICNNLKQEKKFKKVTTGPENSPQKERETRRQTQNRHKQAQNSAKTELLTEIQNVKA